MTQKTYSTKDVATQIGVHRDTLLRWLREGKIEEPERDRNGWRRFSAKQVQAIKGFSDGLLEISHSHDSIRTAKTLSVQSKLAKLEWDFANAKSSYLTHSIHPYPAKYIPQIPKTLIRELASTGDIILDPFCGSGTTLVEALRLDCNGIGIDANPLACLISRAKTHQISEEQKDKLISLSESIKLIANKVSAQRPISEVYAKVPSITGEEVFQGVYDWFESFIVDELYFIRSKCFRLKDKKVKDISLAAFSSIVVTVSKQDSDTRYVRREKNLLNGAALKAFYRALVQAANRSFELSNEISGETSASIIESNVLNPPVLQPVDLVVCSPPYPNAFSYHLYHRTRMMWLEMNQPQFKTEEIGSHRKYSSKGKNAATVDTFRGELYTILSWLKNTLKVGGYACFVIGDSTLKGVRIQNDKILCEVAEDLGYKVEANINRTIQSTRKSFNPKIGKIKEEHIVVLSNS